MSLAIAGVYFFLLAAFGWHIATHFSYSMDMLGYMGNVALRETVDPVKVHAAWAASSEFSRQQNSSTILRAGKADLRTNQPARVETGLKT